jgi:hypothetical protein
LSSSKTGSLGFRDMSPHLLGVSASKTYRPYLFVSRSEGQEIRNTIDKAESPIANLTIVAAVVHESHLDIEIDPARERHTVLRQIDRILGRVEISHCLYIQFVGVSVKRGKGVM